MHAKSFVLSMIALSCTVPFLVCAADWNPLPDTGQTTCYDVSGNVIGCPAEGEALHGQDAQYDGPALAYQDNGNGTVTDLNTGLMWQQPDDGIRRTWYDAIDYCGALSLGGHDDWRLPEIIELISIVDYGRFNPAINPVFTCTSRSSSYWSATTNAESSGFAWTVSFGIGFDSYPRKDDDDDWVRCVRAGL